MNTPTRLLALTVTVLLVAAGVESRMLSAQGQAKDLDRMSDAQLLRDLIAEIDDILEGHDPNEVVDDDTVGEILDALHDDGDDGVEAEIDFEDLVEEMGEAHTSVEAVVEGALGLRVAGGGSVGDTVVARRAAPPRRREAPSLVARALVTAIKSKSQ